MEEELSLQKPIDRRLEKTSDLPLGPPGVEADASDYEIKPKSEVVKKSHRRRSSSSNSPTPRKRRSSSRRRRSPSPRRYRGSPSNRRRYDGDNWYRSKRGRDRDSSRDRERNRSRRSNSRERGSYRNKRRSRSYSPRRNENSPARPPPPPTMPVINQNPMQAAGVVRAPNAPYTMMPNPLYGETYAESAMYNQYNMPPPGQPPFVAPPNSYNIQPQAQYNSNFATAWNGAEAYVQQQQWMQQAPPSVLPVVVPPPAPILSNVQQELGANSTNAVTTDKNSKDDAVALEAENHRGELKKQRVGYMRKMRGLVMELMEMRNGKNHPEENNKVKQQQLERKIGAIENVIDMLTNIIGDREEFEDKHGHERIGINNNFNTSTAVNKHERPKDVLERFKKALRATMTADGDDDKNIGANLAGFDSDSSESSTSSETSNSSSSTTSSYAKKKATDDSDDESSSERLKTKAIESMRAKKAAAAAAAAVAHKNQLDECCNYTFYDPETHWCRTCNVFPKTARDYLNHLHSTEHIQKEAIETPWHEIIPQDSFPVLENVETKRVPVRGLMFLSPASSWFCKLCKFWIGDLHCASLHLKSQTHFKKYYEYIAQNPNFEIEWESERLKKRNENMHKIQPVENDYTISSSKAFLSGKHKRASSNDSDSSGNGLNLTRMPTKTTKKVKHITEPKEVLEADSTVAPPPPPKISNFRAKSKESDTEDDMKKNRGRKVNKELPPIISESEKKLLVQLKGKIKPAEESEGKKRERSKSREVERRRGSSERRKNSRSRSRSRHRRRSRSRSVSVGRNRRNRRRSRSRGRRSISRGREAGWNRGRRNFRRSRSLRRRSRSPRRRRSRTYSRSRSISPVRVEKAIVKHSEFRPRVPEVDKKKKEIKEKTENSKKSSAKLSSTSTLATNGNGSNKKLPFIGKMPVLNKKTATGLDVAESAMDPNQQSAGMYGPMAMRPHAPTAAQIQMAMMEDVYGNAPPFHPDAGLMPMDYDDLMPDPVQYVNLMGPVPPPPPPRSGNKLEDAEADSDSDMLPPGIDPVEETEEEVQEESKPPPPAATSLEAEDKSLLPKDLEEALNIIFPGEKKEEDIEQKKKDSTETTIITDEPVMQAEDLVKEGIHMMTSEDLNAITMDEASQMSMNEPLIFKSRNNEAIVQQIQKTVEMVPPPPIEIPTPEVIPMPDEIPISNDNIEESNKNTSIAGEEYDLNDIPRPPPSPTDSEKHRRQEALDDLALLGIDADDMAAQCM